MKNSQAGVREAPGDVRKQPLRLCLARFEEFIVVFLEWQQHEGRNAVNKVVFQSSKLQIYII